MIIEVGDVILINYGVKIKVTDIVFSMNDLFYVNLSFPSYFYEDPLIYDIVLQNILNKHYINLSSRKRILKEILK